MAKLELYTGREPHVITIDSTVDGKAQKKEFKIPSDFTVEELERIYECEDRLGETKDARERWTFIFSQLLIIFKRYQPDITLDALKSYLTRSQALKVIEFVAENSLGISEKNEDGEVVDGKKKQRVKN